MTESALIREAKEIRDKEAIQTEADSKFAQLYPGLHQLVRNEGRYAISEVDINFGGLVLTGLAHVLKLFNNKSVDQMLTSQVLRRHVDYELVELRVPPAIGVDMTTEVVTLGLDLLKERVALTPTHANIQEYKATGYNSAYTGRWMDTSGWKFLRRANLEDFERYNEVVQKFMEKSY